MNAETEAQRKIRFLQLGHKLAKEIGAYESLGIQTPEERTFFDRELLLYFIPMIDHEFRPLNNRVREILIEVGDQALMEYTRSLREQRLIDLAINVANVVVGSHMIPHYTIDNINTFICGSRKDVSRSMEGRPLLDGVNMIRLREGIARFS